MDILEVKHRILGELCKMEVLYINSTHPDRIEMTFKELSDNLKVSVNEIKKAIDPLALIGEVELINNVTEPKSCHILRPGSIAYNENKYLKEFQNDWWKKWDLRFNVISKPVVVVIAIGSFIVSIVSLCISQSNAEEKIKTQKTLDSLQLRMRSLEATDKQKLKEINSVKPMPNIRDTLKK